jgi:branched-chain amino acid transport system substrate-binding protein
MSALLKYAIFLASALVIGAYVYGTLGPEGDAVAPTKPDATIASVLAEKAPGSTAAGVWTDKSPDAPPASEAGGPAPSSPGKEVAALTPDEVCLRDEDRLRLLRESPSSEEAQRFLDELGCEKLRPQLLALMESSGYAVSTRAAADVSNIAPTYAKAAIEDVGRARPSPGTEVETLAPDLSKSAPAPAAADAPSRPPPEAKVISEAERPARLLAGAEVATLPPDEVCKRDADRLARLRGDPSSDEAERFAKELGCEKLWPQLQRLLESLGQPVTAEVPTGAPPEREAAGSAPPSSGSDVANESSVGASNAAAPPSAESSGESPDKRAMKDAERPSPPPPRPAVADASSVAAVNPAAPPPAQLTAPQENGVHGITDKEIVFGMAGPFSGASRELGRQMKIGVETAFNQINDAGGVNGRLLRLESADDGYEPTRTADAMRVLYDKFRVFGFIGNVGTPTAAVALPFALEHGALFFGAFSGANLLRRDPPDRYVFNYRASYAEETNAVVHYLVKVRRIQPKEIVVFAQQDSYGDSGYAGVEKAVRSLSADNPEIVRLNYKRNTVDVQDAVNGLRAFKGRIKAVVMVASYRAAAKFIEKTHDLYPSLIYTNVSFVGSTALADELMLLGPRYTANVIVTQVVPAFNSDASIVLKYKEAIAKYFPGESPDYVAFEGYIDANILAQAVKRAGRDINTERLVDELEQAHDFDLGLGQPVRFSSNEHQGSHKVWGTQLDETGHYQPIDLQ